MTPALLLAAALALPVRAAGVALPPGVELVLPRAADLEAGWTLPPSPEDPTGAATTFAVAPDGAVWLVLDGQVVSVPEKKALFAADRPFQQLVWVAGKAVARSYETLGVFLAGPAGGPGLPRAAFKPLTTVPLTSWRLAPAGGTDAYLSGFNPRKRVSQIALVGPAAGDKSLRVLHETPARIAAVAGDGRRTYFASGPSIWEVDEDGETSVFWAHESRPIRDLLLAPGGGLFYTTDAGVGYAGTRARFDFLRAEDCRIATAKDDLYILLGGLRGGLLRLRGVSRFAKVGFQHR